MRNRPLLQLALIGVLASVVGVGLGLLIDWFPTQAAEEAGPIDTLYDVLLAASIPVFVLVMTVAIYSVIKFRARPGDQRDGAPIHGNAKLEVIWVTVPFILVTALAVYGWVVLVDIEEPSPDAMVVEVRGEQFTWSFAYPEEGDTPTVQSNSAMLPLDRQVEFRIDTEDVIHSFWVPAFRLKSDTVPGVTTEVRVTPSEEGTFDVVCAELCGLGHSTMRQSVTVVPQDEFDTWLADEQDALAAEEAGEPAEDQSPSGVAAQEPAPAEEDGAEPSSGGGEEQGGGGGNGASKAPSERPQDGGGPGDA
jgi:cytochrome c oxidase subunit 2